MVRTALCAIALASGALGLVACGASDTTTVTREATQSEANAEVEALTLEKERAEAEAEAAKAQAKGESAAQVEHEPASESEPEEVPDVVGLRLPEAKSALKAAGYTARAENTDTLFGIVVPSHYTVCEQSEPVGNVVHVLAQKYGC